MSARALLTAALAVALAGCGGDARREVRVLAPAWIEVDLQRFEEESGCRADLRVYDDGERLEPIAERRDADVVAARVQPGSGDQTEEFVRVRLSGVEVKLPRRLAAAVGGRQQPAGRRSIVWRLRPEGDNDECGRRWIAYVTSQ